MACSVLTTGIYKNCDNNLGSIKKLWIADKSDGWGITISASNDQITYIAAPSSSEKFFLVEFNKNTSQYTEEVPISLENGSTYYKQQITLVLSRRDNTKRDFIKKLTAGQRNFWVMVQDQNDIFWMFGYSFGMNVTTLTGGSGLKKEDLNGYNITMIGEEPNQAYTVKTTLSATGVYNITGVVVDANGNYGQAPEE